MIAPSNVALASIKLPSIPIFILLKLEDWSNQKILTAIITIKLEIIGIKKPHKIDKKRGYPLGYGFKDKFNNSSNDFEIKFSSSNLVLIS